MKSLLLISILSFFYITESKGQADPLAKPEKWAQLTHNPSDLILWANYLGKPLDSLKSDDAKNILIWSKELQVSDNLYIGNAQLWEAIPIESHAAFEDLRNKAEALTFQYSVGDDAQNYQPDFGELTEDIEGNFVIIEDILRAKFEEMGTEYETYLEIYPKKNYSKIGWIDDKIYQLENLQTFSLVLLKARTGL